MIEYLRGEIAELTPATAVIDCAGVGYEASITLNTYSAIQGKKDTKLYIYEVIREDTHQLFGFFNKQERELFLLLISVSGIGGNTARTILSAFTIGELCDVIASGDEKTLKGVKGIGLKSLPSRGELQHIHGIVSRVGEHGAAHSVSFPLTEGEGSLEGNPFEMPYAGRPGSRIPGILRLPACLETSRLISSRQFRI